MVLFNTSRSRPPNTSSVLVPSIVSSMTLSPPPSTCCLPSMPTIASDDNARARTSHRRIIGPVCQSSSSCPSCLRPSCLRPSCRRGSILRALRVVVVPSFVPFVPSTFVFFVPSWFVFRLFVVPSLRKQRDTTVKPAIHRTRQKKASKCWPFLRRRLKQRLNGDSTVAGSVRRDETGRRVTRCLDWVLDRIRPPRYNAAA